MKNIRFIVRRLKNSPLLVFVNLPGLAVGISAVLLLSVYVGHELSFDKHFSTKDRVLRLYNKITDSNRSVNYAICLRNAYTQIPEKVPEIQSATQLYRGQMVNVNSGQKHFSSMDLLYADRGFFDVFGLNLLYGDRNTALDGSNKVVLSVLTAQKIFNTNDCVGKIISISDESYVVSGVIKNLPKTTHFNFDLLGSMQTCHPEKFGGLEFFTYFLIRENADIENVGQKIAEANNDLLKPMVERFHFTAESGAEQLSQLHLYSIADFDLSPKANLTHILIVASIAFFILLIALINYINLYVAHGEQRIAEIGARKSMGASPKRLAGLFYAETGIIGFAAFILAVIIVLGIQPYFATLMQRTISVSETFSFQNLCVITGVLVLLVLVSGAYPTFYLSRINLVSALKGKSDQIKRKSRLSVISVLVQFVITVFLICSLIVIHTQINYLKDVPYGFTPQNIVGIEGFSVELGKKHKSLVDEFERISFVESVGCSHHRMGGGCSGQGIRIYGKEGSRKPINEYRVQPGFCRAMQLQLLKGRFFNDNVSDKKSVILNEAAVKMLGLDNPVGTMVEMRGAMKVIAVVKDFYYTDHPGEPIAPLMITNYSDKVSAFYLRIMGGITPGKQEQLASIMKKHDPNFIFKHFELVDDYANKFAGEDRVMKLVSTGTFFAILISFIGLMALSVMNVARRTKEIGVRKVLGSTIKEVMFRLLRETLTWVFISMLIAFVFTYLIMQHWLSGFVNRIDLHIGYFLLSGFITLLIALFATSWQSWRAATRNPVESLRYE